MTTINGITFNMVNLRPVAVHRNSISEQPGSDTNFITDMGYDGLVLRLEGFQETLATYDSVISEFMKSGEQTLVYRSGWQFKVYSAQLTPELIEGIVDNYFPYDLILYTSTPYRESTTLDCRAKAITANNQEWSAEDMPCNNLLDNWSFEDWAGGPSSAPDGWSGVNSPTIIQSSDSKLGTYSTSVTSSATNTRFRQTLSDPTKYRGKIITGGAWVKTSCTSTLLRVADSVSGTSDTHSGSGNYEWLTATRTIDDATNSLEIQLYPDSVGGTESAIIDGAVLIEGDSIPDNTFIRDIDTDGSVNAVPDIKIMGGAVGTTLNRDSDESWDDTYVTQQTEVGTSWQLTYTKAYTAKNGRNYIIDTVGMDFREEFLGNDAYGKVTHQAASLNGGAETDIPGASWSDNYDGDWASFSETDIDIVCAHNETVTIRWYTRTNSGSDEVYSKNFDSVITTKRLNVCKEPIVYNTADTTVKSEVANEIEPDMVFRINTDGTGTITYADDFTTDKYQDAYLDQIGTTYDDANDELDFANSSYIIYKIDTKYPITGIPEFLSTIDIDSGTPTIKISEDDITYYDIDTAIVDNISTVYPLDNTANLSLKGQTTYYIKINCDGSSTCSLTTFSLSIGIVTVDVEHPIINESGVSTYRCDQHTDSGLNCEISLRYRDRGWPA